MVFVERGTRRAIVAERRTPTSVAKPSPLGIVVLLTTLNSSIPSFFHQAWDCERDLGIFSRAWDSTISCRQHGRRSLDNPPSHPQRPSGISAAFGSLPLSSLLWSGLGVSACSSRNSPGARFSPCCSARVCRTESPLDHGSGCVLFMAQFWDSDDCGRFFIIAVYDMPLTVAVRVRNTAGDLAIADAP